MGLLEQAAVPYLRELLLWGVYSLQGQQEQEQRGQQGQQERGRGQQEQEQQGRERQYSHWAVQG